MGETEDSLATLPFDREVQRAIVSIKKGACLLKCGRRGKPKFCPFRLSTDENSLLWYSGQKERQLRLSSVTKIVPGQKTVTFQRQLQPEKDCHSFSLIYAHGERSLDLICKDKVQADTWILGLRALISKWCDPRSIRSWRSRRDAQSCVNSPAGFMRRKCNLGLPDYATEFSQVRSLCGSPTLSLSKRCLSDGLSYSSDSFYSSESILSTMENSMTMSMPTSPFIEASDGLSYSSDSFYSSESILSTMENSMTMSMPTSPFIEADHHKEKVPVFTDAEYDKKVPHSLVTPNFESLLVEKRHSLKDVFIWGKQIGVTREEEFGRSIFQVDTLFPKLFQSATMLDVQSMSFGGKHAALVTKQGEVFTWGEANGGVLGQKFNNDVKHPELVDSLSGVQVKSITCSEYQTCAVTHGGEIYTWGLNNCGTVLLGEERKRNQWLPYKLSGTLDAVSVLSVSCGEWHTAVVSTSGKLFTYGDGTFGVLGHGNCQSFSQPKEVESLKGLRVKSVACGSWHTAAIVDIVVGSSKFNFEGGKLFTWGDGDKGKLGHDGKEKKLLPTCVAELVDLDFVQVCCGRMLTVALTNEGVVYTMGSAVHGQLGNPKAKDKSITVVDGNLKEEFIREIASGSYHVAVLTTGGNVYTWGKGENGQLGLGDVEDRNTPTSVESLKERHVESIACGSNTTAAVCVHKSVSVRDQSACNGCKFPFGFIRKKHNCYNCGFLFCHACSSRKATNASLAPNKSKVFRVCHSCFNSLQGFGGSGGLLKLHFHGSKQLLTENKVLLHGKESKGVATPKCGQTLSVKQSCNKEGLNGESATVKSQQNLDSVSLFTGLPLWGQVACPALFKLHCGEDSVPFSPLCKNQLLSVAPVLNESNVSITTNSENDMSMSDDILIEEIQLLRAQATKLENECQIGSQKIRECRQKVEKTWSLAREEAAKCNAAKEVIKALALRLQKTAVGISTVRKVKDGVKSNLVQATRLNKDNSALEDLGPVVVDEKLSPGVEGTEYKQVECNRSDEGHLSISKMELRPKESKDVLKHEWVEQYVPGVYLTFTILPTGQKGFKRVRFSRKKFTDREAVRWWEENQELMYQKYCVDM